MIWTLRVHGNSELRMIVAIGEPPIAAADASLSSSSSMGLSSSKSQTAVSTDVYSGNESF